MMMMMAMEADMSSVALFCLSVWSDLFIFLNSTANYPKCGGKSRKNLESGISLNPVHPNNQCGDSAVNQFHKMFLCLFINVFLFYFRLPYAGDNFVRWSGDAYEIAKKQSNVKHIEFHKSPGTMTVSNTIIIYFENVYLFYARLKSDICPIWSSSTYPCILSIPTADQASSCHHSQTFPKSSCPNLYTSSLPPPQICKLTPNRLHSSRSRCPNHLNLPCFTTSATQWTPKDCTNHRFAFYPSTTLHTSTSPSYTLLSRLCRFSAFIAHVSFPYMI